MNRSKSIKPFYNRVICMVSYSVLPCVLLTCASASAQQPEPGPPLPGTKPLSMTGDIASELVAGVDRFLLKQIDESAKTRDRYWKRDFSSLRAYDASVEPNRKRLAHILGVRDPLAQFDTAEHPDDFSYQIATGSGESYSVRSIRWPAFGDVTGEGLETTTHARLPMDTIIVIPDADQTPEQLFGLVPGVPAESQVARRLAENGYNVIVPALIDRTVTARNGRARLTSREFLYRSAFELGRQSSATRCRRCSPWSTSRAGGECPGPTPRSASSVTAKGARSPSTRPPSIRASTPSA